MVEGTSRRKRSNVCLRTYKDSYESSELNKWCNSIKRADCALDLRDYHLSSYLLVKELKVINLGPKTHLQLPVQILGPTGADRDRTDDLLVANQSLSQLSYGPENRTSAFSADLIFDPADKPSQDRQRQDDKAERADSGFQADCQYLKHIQNLHPVYRETRGRPNRSYYSTGPRWIRTIDLTVISGVLYQLSYRP